MNPTRPEARAAARLVALAGIGLLAGCVHGDPSSPPREAPVAAVAPAAVPTAFGGIAYLGPVPDGAEFLVVTDLKGPDDPRLGVLRLDRDGRLSGYATLAPRDWRLPRGALPTDLESLCRLPGDAPRFLAAESGQGRNGHGRLFELALTAQRPAVRQPAAASSGIALPWRVSVTATHALPAAAVPNRLNYEGLLCAPGEGSDVRLLLADRSGSSLRTGRLRRARGVLEWDAADVAPSPWPDPPEWPSGEPALRRIADLALAPDGMVWAAASVDPGDDGPFHSWLYRLGPLAADPAAPATVAALRPAVAHRLDGDKAEGITFDPDGRVVYVSDNENLRSGAGRIEPAR